MELVVPYLVAKKQPMSFHGPLSLPLCRILGWTCDGLSCHIMWIYNPVKLSIWTFKIIYSLSSFWCGLWCMVGQHSWEHMVTKTHFHRSGCQRVLGFFMAWNWSSRYNCNDWLYTTDYRPSKTILYRPFARSHWPPCCIVRNTWLQCQTVCGIFDDSTSDFGKTKSVA